jgi:hypothetical protein
VNGDPASPEFQAAYHAALRGEKQEHALAMVAARGRTARHKQTEERIARKALAFLEQGTEPAVAISIDTIIRTATCFMSASRYVQSHGKPNMLIMRRGTLPSTRF